MRDMGPRDEEGVDQALIIIQFLHFVSVNVKQNGDIYKPAFP